MKNLDILAVGDTVIDAFIRLKEAEVHCNVDHKNCELCVKFGQKIPYESVDVCNAVGNSPNASVSAARLGLASGLLSYVGNDKHGQDCLDELKKNGVDLSSVHTEDGKTTNYHYVLWYDVDRTILIKHEKFDYTLDGVNPPKWLYLSSLGEHTLPFHKEIAEYITNHPDVKLAFQPGTFQIKFGTDELRDIYARSEIVCCNVEEAQIILKEESRDLKVLLKKFTDLGPKKVLITDGFAGAYAYDGEKYLFMPVYPHHPFEITGAGDAFFSTIVSCLAMGKEFHEALRYGPINSMSVTQFVGAQKGLLTLNVIEDYLTKAPAEYTTKEI
jgi:sugar/nucleoside kinase (ribokinase family)